MDEDSPEGRPRSQAGTAGAALLFCAVLTVQVAVPLTRLGSSGTTRFGWQMFSSFAYDAVYSVRAPGGGLDTVRVMDYLVGARQEIELHSLLPAHLCRRIEGAEAVVVEWPAAAGRDRMEFPCR